MRCIAILSLVASTAIAAPEITDADRRLAAAGKAWGRVAFLHPALHEPRVDWDQAYIDAVPAIIAARDAAEYRAAVASMAAALGDPETQVVTRSDPASEPPTVALPAGEWLVESEGRLTLSCVQAAALRVKDAKVYATAIATLPARLERSRALVVDCRALGAGLPLYDWQAGAVRTASVRAVLDEVAANLSSAPLLAGIRRHREHSGFAPETGSSSGGYGSAMEYEPAQTLPGRATRKPPPTVIVLDDRADAAINAAAALQRDGLARVVHLLPPDGAPSALWVDVARIDLGEGLQLQFPVRELTVGDGRGRFRPFATVRAESELAGAMDRALKAGRAPADAAPAAGGPVAPAWRAAKEADPAQRVFAMVRAWTILDLFFPYRELMDRPLDGLLPEYVARARAAASTLDYHWEVGLLGNELNDSHVGQNYAHGTALSERIGLGTPPLALRFVGERALFAPLKDPAPLAAAGLAPGDELLAIDGKPIAARVAELAPGGSTPQSRLAQTTRWLLRGPPGSKAMLKVRSVEGRVFETTVERSLSFRDAFDLVRDPEHEGPVWRRLDAGYGYIDLVRLDNADVDKALDELMDTPALILDMRGYPRGTAWRLAPRLGDHAPGAVAARFRRPLVGPDLAYDSETARADYAFQQRLPVRDAPRYRGKVVVLIDERAISQSEHSCMFYEVAADARFVGSPTTGANGDVTSFRLPGGLTFRFTGHDVRHADGRQLQRVGIQPDVVALPTPAGIKAGRDEVLEAAVGYLVNELAPRKGRR